MSDDLISLGTGTQEITHTKKEFESLLKAEISTNSTPIQYEIYDYTEVKLSTEIVNCFCKVITKLKDDNDSIIIFKTRFSAVLRRKSNNSEICSLHMSAPIHFQDEEEFFLLKYGLKARNKINAETQKDLIDLMQDMIPGGIAGTYLEPGMPFYVINDELLGYLGYTYNEFMEDTEGFMINIIHPEDVKMVEETLTELVNNNNEYAINYRLKKKDNSYFWVHDRGKQIITDDGREVVIFIIMDISQTIELQEKLIKEATLDPLTHIYNRREAFRLIEILINANKIGTLIIIDIDNFKEINDEYGHFAGDEVLTDLATILQYNTRKNDIVARLGGDEFIIYFSKIVDRKYLINKAELLCQEFYELEQKKYPILSVGISIGGATHYNKEKLTELYNRADQLLYQVKENLKGAVKIS